MQDPALALPMLAPLQASLGKPIQFPAARPLCFGPTPSTQPRPQRICRTWSGSCSCAPKKSYLKAFGILWEVCEAQQLESLIRRGLDSDRPGQQAHLDVLRFCGLEKLIE